ncbi:MAG: AAA family ATPase [Bacilli bacterium]|nr:AAA family ATPase [Bacilli bacterium]
MREDVINLIQWLLVDVDLGIKLLKIPIKVFNDEELEDMYKTIVNFKKQYGVVTQRELSELAKRNKFNWEIFIDGLFYEYLEIKNYSPNVIKTYIDFYQQKILKEYKDNALSNLQSKYVDNEISIDDFVKQKEVIDEYEINSENNFKDIHELDLTDEERVYISSGVRQIDRDIKGFALGELSVWSGGNGSAKSTFLNQLALESINQNYNVAIYSGELTSKRLLQWITLQASGKDNVVDVGGFYKPTEDAKSRILYWLDGKLFVFDNARGNKKQVILQSIRDVVEKKKVKVVIIDNLMSIELDNASKYDEQSAFIKELSNMAKELNIHIHFVCHPRKTTLFLRKNDISGTADLTNIADNVFILHRVGKDFIRNFKETFDIRDDKYGLFSYSNVIEICKNREYGVQDEFVGLFYEKESKRLLNNLGETKIFGWESMR